jgi:tripartite-type tricarboxylate transporter receptor subunit TctC
VARDLAGRQVDIFMTPYGPSLMELIKQGKLKAMAALSQQRQPAAAPTCPPRPRARR